MIWGFCYCMMVFWTIRFPFHYRSYQNTRRIKYIHVALILAGLILPGVPVIVTLATHKFTLTMHPSQVCLIDNLDIYFYSFFLPLSILLSAATSLLIAVFYEMHKVRYTVQACETRVIN